MAILFFKTCPLHMAKIILIWLFHLFFLTRKENKGGKLHKILIWDERHLKKQNKNTIIFTQSLSVDKAQPALDLTAPTDARFAQLFDWDCATWFFFKLSCHCFSLRIVWWLKTVKWWHWMHQRALPPWRAVRRALACLSTNSPSHRSAPFDIAYWAAWTMF